jgi:DNA invertase Pin-like site-specific DNA recombinase
MGSMVCTVRAALAQMELEIKRERITDSMAMRQAVGKDLGERRQTFTDSLSRNALRLIDLGSRPDLPGSFNAAGVPGEGVGLFSSTDPGACDAATR